MKGFSRVDNIDYIGIKEDNDVGYNYKNDFSPIIILESIEKDVL